MTVKEKESVKDIRKRIGYRGPAKTGLYWQCGVCRNSKVTFLLIGGRRTFCDRHRIRVSYGGDCDDKE